LLKQLLTRSLANYQVSRQGRKLAAKVSIELLPDHTHPCIPLETGCIRVCGENGALSADLGFMRRASLANRRALSKRSITQTTGLLSG
jgi:hypothetical protein